MPVYITITSSGKKPIIKSTAEVWKDGKTVMLFQTKLPFAEIDKVELGNEFIPDKFDKNNIWIQKK